MYLAKYINTSLIVMDNCMTSKTYCCVHLVDICNKHHVTYMCINV